MKQDHIRDCGECGMIFDARDRRAFVPENAKLYPKLEPVCPACNMINHGAEAWACWNGCQGVFTDAVFNSRAEANAKKEEWGEAVEKVVPVCVIVEPEDNWFGREIDEETNERIAARAAPESAGE
jgi:hypothetical protein